MSTLDTLRDDLQRLGIHDQVDAACILYLAYTTRQMHEKLSVILAGPSSAGKSTLARKVLDLIPNEEKVEVSFITKAALLRKGDLSDKVILIHEHLEDPSLAAPLRLLASEGEVRSQLCSNGAVEELVLRGPAAVVETTTRPQAIGFEDRNRSLVVTVSPTDEELSNRYERIKAKWSTPRSGDSYWHSLIVSRHYRWQRSLRKDIDVVLPFASRVQFRSRHPHAQRLLDNFFRLVSAIAFLDQDNRKVRGEKEGRPFIEATEEDYRDAYRLARAVSIDTGDDVLPEDSGKLYAALKGHDRFTRATPFTRLEISRHLPEWTYKRVRNWIGPLVDNDLLRCGSGPNGRHEYIFTSLGRELGPDQVFRNCLATLTPPEELAALSGLPTPARELGQAETPASPARERLLRNLALLAQEREAQRSQQ